MSMGRLSQIIRVGPKYCITCIIIWGMQREISLVVCYTQEGWRHGWEASSCPSSSEKPLPNRGETALKASDVSEPRAKLIWRRWPDRTPSALHRNPHIRSPFPLFFFFKVALKKKKYLPLIGIKDCIKTRPTDGIAKESCFFFFH